MLGGKHGDFTVADAEALKIKISGQLDSLERGLTWLKDGTLSAGSTSRDAEMISHYERIIAALKAQLTELG